MASDITRPAAWLVDGTVGSKAPEAGIAGLFGRLAAAPLIFWVVFAAGLVGGFDVWQRFARLSLDYGDLDDALRMVQVRELMAYGHWYDTTLARMGGDGGMLSHWSRLIDLPLALLIGLLSKFVSMPDAELTIRLLWPVLLLGVLFLAVGRVVEVAAGRFSALIALALLALCPSAISQFSIGRVDHHNAQNLAAAAAILLLWLIGRVPNAGRWAGLISGLGLAVGYEALPILIMATAAAALWGLWEQAAAQDVRSYFLWLAGTLTGAFIATVPIARWSDMHCDALASNLVLMALIAAGGAAVAWGRGTAWSSQARWIIVLSSGAIALFTGFALEPQCLAGPLGQMPSELMDVWLAHVPEGRSWLHFLKTEPHGALAVAILFSAALGWLGHQLWHERRAADAFYFAVFLISLPLAFRHMKYLPYSSILAIPPLAMMLMRLPAIASLSAPTVRLAAFLIFNQVALMMTVLQVQAIAGTAAAAGTYGNKADMASPVIETGSAARCYQHNHLAVLNRYSAGLVFAPIDLGSHLIADTHHRVLAGPYHRIGAQILETHAVLQSKGVHEAERRLRRLNANYVLICPAIGTLLTPVIGDPETFDAHLRRGDAMPFLRPVELPAGSPFKMWRISATGDGTHGR
jgi:hypothetical protein